jgi:serine protease Do
MRKAILAGVLAAVTIGAVAGGMASFSASQDDAQLQISDEAKGEADAVSEDAAKESEAAVEDAQPAEEETDLPAGEITKADLVDVSDAAVANSGVAEVATNVMPAMVSITNTSVQEVMDWFRGGNFQYESKSLGTGVIMGENDEELLIVTNNHVVADSSELTVSFIDEESVEGVIKGTDAGDDLAVVAVRLEDIPAETMEQIRIANVADSEDVRVGEQVVAIGNALGYGQSVTTGIVSALGRTITVADESGYNEYTDLIQTDAAINQGNSGGALLNMKGEVIGINSVKAGASGVEGMGYAISTSKALPIIRNLMNKKTRELVSEDQLPYLGIVGQDVTRDVAQLYGLPEGIYVTELSEDGPSDQAGIIPGMIITGFDGESIDSMSDLQELLPYYAGGETVSITVSVQNEDGEYEEQSFDVTLGLRSDYVQDSQ